jgi:hypothetical protein
MFSLATRFASAGEESMARESGGAEGYEIGAEVGSCAPPGAVDGVAGLGLNLGTVGANPVEGSMARSSLASGARGMQGAVVEADASSVSVGAEATAVEKGGSWGNGATLASGVAESERRSIETHVSPNVSSCL